MVGAIVDSYKTEVVDVEAEQKRTRFSEVDRAAIEKDQDIRAKRQELRNLANEAGAVDPDSLAQRVQHAFSQLNILTTESAGMQGKFAEVKSELEANKELLKSVDKMEIPPGDIDALIRSDQVADSLGKQLAFLKLQQSQNKQAAKPGARSPYAEQLARQLESVQEQYDQKLDELKEKAARRSAIQDRTGHHQA